MLAVVAGRGAGAIWVFLAVMAGQLFVGWTNDYVDRRTDRAAERGDKPLARGEIDPRIVAGAALAALAAAIPLSLASGAPAAFVHFVALGSATAYNLGLKGSPLSPAPYAVSFGLLPVFITLGLSHPHLPPGWVVAAAALIGVGGHFAQSRPDVESDRAVGVRGLPERAGDRGSAILAALCLAGGAGVVAIAAGNLLPLVALVPAVGVAIASPRTAYLLTLAAAGVAAIAFVAIAGAALR